MSEQQPPFKSGTSYTPRYIEANSNSVLHRTRTRIVVTLDGKVYVFGKAGRLFRLQRVT